MNRVLFTPSIVGLVCHAVLGLSALASAQQVGSRAAGAAGTRTSRPNIVFILIDDLRHDAMSCAGHPFAKTPNIDRIATSGVRFTNAFVTTSLCGPSRASILTGMYVHSHGVQTNEEQELDPKWPTFPKVLQASGYQTGFVGKWHMNKSPRPRPGFDYWLGFPGQGVYIDPALNENGRDFKATGYLTDLLTDYAVKWLKQPRSKPFCLYLSHKAVHADWVPAERHKDLYSDVTLPEPASYKDDLAGKPQWQRVQKIRGGQFKKPAPPVIPERITPSQWPQRGPQQIKTLNYYRTLAGVDDSVGRVLDTLREIGQLDNTVIFFMGDNGFFQGEHGGLGDKRLAYEESIRIPLLACGPGIPRRGLVTPMALNIDIAPTLIEMAGATIPPTVEGQSLTSIMRGFIGPWRDSFIYEYYLEQWLPGIPTMKGVRTLDWKHVRYPEIKDLDELYDLKADPIEMHNLATDPAYAGQIRKMRELESHPNWREWKPPSPAQTQPASVPSR